MKKYHIGESISMLTKKTAKIFPILFALSIIFSISFIQPLNMSGVALACESQTEQLDAPGGVQADYVWWTFYTVWVRWSSVADADKYKIERKLSSETAWSTIATVDAEEELEYYDSSGLQAAFEYDYRVIALPAPDDSAHTESNPSSSDSALLPPVDPSGFTAEFEATSGGTAAHIHLEWDDDGIDDGGYHLFRAPEPYPNTSAIQLGSPSHSTHEYDDSNIGAGQHYYYALFRYNAFGWSYNAAIADETTPAQNIQKLQWAQSSSGPWTDVSGTLLILKGTTVYFKAIKTIPSAAWPSGKPAWGGTSGASGTGEIRAVVFNTLSASSSNFKTVTSECGNTKTANAVVFELTGDLTPDDNFAGRWDDIYGLDESVQLTHSTNPSGISPSLAWILAYGVGSVSGSIYDAGPTPGDAYIWLQITEGPSQNAFIEYEREVIEPWGEYMTQFGTGIRHKENTSSCGFRGIAHLQPAFVSFTNLEWREGAGTSVATGFWATLNGQVHTQGIWCDVLNGNSSTGSMSSGLDEIYNEKTPPYSIGTFHWPVSHEYRASDMVVHQITISHHYAESDAAGKCTIEKGGAGPFSKNASDPDSSW